MAKVGLLAEEIYLRGMPIFLGTAAPDAWPALRAGFESATPAVDFLAVELHPTDAQGGFIVFSSSAFSARPAPALAKLFKIRGQSAVQVDAKTAAGYILGAPHASGARVSVSDGWHQFIQI